VKLHTVGMTLCLVLVTGMLAVLVSAGLPAAPALAQMATPKPPVQSDTTLKVSPSSPTVNAGETFDVLLRIDTDQMTWGMQAGLRFDPKLIEVVKIEEGDFYKTWAAANGAQTLIVPGKPTADNAKGVVPTMGITLLGTGAAGKGPSGSGTWLVVRAKAKAGVQGIATFELYDVKVLDVDPVKPIPMAGVKVAAGQVAIGAVKGSAATPTAAAVAMPTSAREAARPATATPAPVSTVRIVKASTTEAEQEVESSEASPIPWELIIPVAAVVVVGAVVVVTTRRRPA
jgi:hypothetical protein